MTDLERLSEQLSADLAGYERAMSPVPKAKVRKKGDLMATPIAKVEVRFKKTSNGRVLMGAFVAGEFLGMVRTDRDGYAVVRLTAPDDPGETPSSGSLSSEMDDVG